jgi:hypothetical protein
MGMLQLNPSIPVFVTDKGKGEAVGWIDYDKEGDLIWIVALDENGQVWLAPNYKIRFLNNYSVDRIYDVKKE